MTSRATGSRRPRARASTLLLSLVARLGGWLRRWWQGRAPAKRPLSRALSVLSPQYFETLEARLLLSADLMPSAAAHDTLLERQLSAAELARMPQSGASSTVVDRLALAVPLAAVADAMADLTDGDGSVLSVAVSGPGSASLVAEAGGYRLLLSGTDGSSAVTLSAVGGDGIALLTGITADQSVGRLDLSAARLTGDADFAGSLRSLTLGSAAGATLHVAGGGELAFKAGAVDDTRLLAGQAVLSAEVERWTAGAAGASRVEAASVRGLAVAGEFAADLRAGRASDAQALGYVRVGGALSGGVWSVTGRAGSVEAQSTVAAWRANFTGTLNQLVTRGQASGSVAVAGLQLLQVGGSAQGLQLLVGADLGSDAQLGGSASAADTFRAGTLALMQVAGDVVDSRIAVGIDPRAGGYGDADDVLLGGGANRLQDLRIGGALRGSTQITAPAFAATVSIGGVTRAIADVPQLSTAAGDSLAPVLAAALKADTGVSSSDGITRDATVRGSVVDAGGVQSLRGRFGDGAFQALDVTFAPDGSFELGPALLAVLNGGSLLDGSHRLQLQAVDRAGNTSAVQSIALMLDTVAPVLSFGLAAADALNAEADQTAAARVQLRGLSEAGGSVVLDGRSPVLVNTSGAFVMADVALATGANALTLTATDAAGNTATASRTLTRVVQAVADPSLKWNEVALKAIQLDVTDPPQATRMLAMQSVAMYDTLAAIEGTPAFLVQGQASGPTSVEAAVAQAAYRVLWQLFPAQRAIFDAALASSLGAIADGEAKTAGVALGDRIARAVIAIRANDGYLDFATSEGSDQIGQWRPTGPMFLTADNPQWVDVAPFAMDSPDQFRAAVPPALDSAEYAAAMEEVRLLGAANSSTRTADQTQQAHFWSDGAGSYTPPGHWNLIATQVAAAQGNSLSANARMLAQLNVALADAAIAAWDTKYAYDTWRPITAIPLADLDGNPGTAKDANWVPLLITPPHPDYVSGHSTFSAAAAEVLNAVFGENVAFTTVSLTLPGVTRSFTSFDQAAEEAGWSRIYGGIHTSFANLAGKVMGTQVADAVLARFALQQDTKAPVVVAADTPAASRTNLSLTGQVLDNLSGVTLAQYRIDGGAWQALALDAEGGFAIATSFALDGSADGTHTIAVQARDAAGNTSAVFTRGFVLGTRAPVLTLAGLPDGAALAAGSRFTGSAVAGSGADLVALSYQFQGSPAMPVSFDAATGAFDTAFDLSRLGAGTHTLTVRATDAAGNVAARDIAVTLASAIPLTVTEITPQDGSTEVGSAFKPKVVFSRAVDAASLTDANFYATDSAGQKLAATIVVGGEGRFAWLFFTAPLPTNDTVTLHLDGSSIRSADGSQALDADGNGTAGGVRLARFSTVNLVPVPGTTLTGRVVDPGADLKPMSFDDIRRGPDGVIHTPDDVFLNPIAGARVWILGRESEAVLTDAAGRFTLTNVPAGIVKLAIDGRTATNAPADYFWPEMVMDVVVEPGLVNTVMGGMGTGEEQRANEDREEVYLPRVPTSSLKPIAASGSTTVTVDPKSAPELVDEQRALASLQVAAGSVIGADGQPIANPQIGLSLVPPEMIREMLPPGTREVPITFTIQAPGAAAFTTPLTLTVPNVYGAKAGEKLNFYSFDHASGLMVIEGTATVSADGKSVTTDPGQGITKPGWHGLAPLWGAMVNIANAIGDGLKWFFNSPVVDVVLAGASLAMAAAAAIAGLPLGAAAVGVAGVIVLGVAAVNAGYDFSVTVAKQIDAVARGEKTWGEAATSLLKEGAPALIGGAGGVLSKLGGAVIARAEKFREAAWKSGGADIGAELYAKYIRLDSIGERINLIGSIASKSGALQGTLGDVQKVGGAVLEGAGLLKVWAESNVAAIREPAVRMLEALDRAQAGMYEGVRRLIGDGLDAKGIDTNTTRVLDFDGERVRVLGPDGKPLLDSTGQPADYLIYDLIDPRYFQSPDIAVAMAQDFAISEVAFQAERAAFERDITALLKGIETLPKGESVPLSQKAYVRVSDVLTGQTLYQGDVSRLPREGIFLGAEATYVVDVVDPVSRAAGFGTVTVSGAGTAFWGLGSSSPFGNVPVFQDQSVDSDGDGLSDYAEFVLGTGGATVDSDGDGISDYAEVLAGTDPLGGRAMATGVVGSAVLEGEAKAIVLEGATSGQSATKAYVATGSYGLAIVDVSQATSPRVLGQLDLPGDAVDVDIDPALGIAVVATGSGGVLVVDVSKPAQPRVISTIGVNATQVEVFDGVAYMAVGAELRAYDITTGERLGSTAMTSSVLGLSREGELLYSVDGNRTLRIFRVADGTFSSLGSVGLPVNGGRIRIGSGIAYVAAGNGATGGYMTVDVSNPANPRLLSGVDNDAVAGSAIVPNGSGLALAVGSSYFVVGGFRALDVLDVRDATNTGRVLTRVNLSQVPFDIAVGGGLAFVADGTGDLQVINYLSADTKGVAPAVTADFSALDIDPNTAGIQVLEGSTLNVRPTTADDVQVRNVELLRNGQVVANDVGFPFELGTALPTIAANGGATSMTLQVRATDTGGNFGLSQQVTVQLVRDTFAPTLVSSNVTEGTTKGRSFRAVNLVFSEAVDAASINAGTVQLVGPDGQAVAPLNIQFRQQGREVQITYEALATVGAYELRLVAPAITDRAGNALGAATQVTHFTVRAYTAEWVATGSGFWDVAANWSTGVVPGATDDVFIGLPSSATVTFRTGNTLSVATLTSDARVAVTGGVLTVTGAAALRGGLQVAAGALTLAGDSSVVAGLQLSGGTLTANGSLDVDTLALAGGTLAGSGTVTLAQASTWTSGTLTGTGTLNVNGDLAISGATSKTLNGGRVLNLLGTTTWSGATALNTNDFYLGLSTINNSGTWVDANAFGTVMRTWYDGVATFHNIGTYLKQGAGTSSLELVFHNTGAVRTSAGVLSLNLGGLSEGLLDTVAGATLRFGAGTHTIGAGTTTTGAGRFEVGGTFSSSTLVTVAGTLDVAGELALTGGTLTVDGTLNAARYAQTDSDSIVNGSGTLSVTGAATWSDGTLTGTGTSNFNGDLAITGQAVKSLYGGRVVNTLGNTTWSGNTAALGGRIRFGSATLHNSGTWTDANAFDSLMEAWYSGALVFSNTGRYVKLGAIASTLEASFENNGTVDVQAGVLNLNGGGSSSSSFLLASAATLRFGAGTHTLAGITVTGSGRFEVGGTFSSSTEVVVTGTLDLAGLLALTGGTLTANGTLNAARYAQTDSDSVVAGTGTVAVSGDATWSDGTLSGTGTSTFNGTLAITGQAVKALYGGRIVNTAGATTWSGNTAALGGRIRFGGATLHNTGTWTDANAFDSFMESWYSGALVFDNTGRYIKQGATTSTLEVSLQNLGDVDVQGGILSLNGGGASAARFSIAAGSTLRFGAGTHTLDGISVTGTGRFEVAGTFSSSTNVVTSGTIDLAGVLSMVGGTLTANGTLQAAAYAQTDPDSVLAGTGVITVAGASTWSDGVMAGTGSIVFNGDLAISGQGVKALYGGRALTTAGTTTWSGNTAALGNRIRFGAATIVNTGAWVDANAFDSFVESWYGGTLVFTNAGSYTKQGATTSTLEWAFSSSGTTRATGGVLAFSGTAGGSSSGLFDVAAGAEIAFLAGTNTWLAGAQSTGEGLVSARNLSGSVGGTLAIAGTVTMTHFRLSGTQAVLAGAGTLTLTGTGNEWSAGTMTGGGTTVIASGADLTMSGTVRKFLGSRTITNQGLFTESSSGDLTDLDGTAVFNNLGVFDLRSDQAWQHYGGTVGTLVFNNGGTLRKSAGTGNFQLLDTALNNTGLVEVLLGTLEIGGNGGTSNGTFSVAAGSEIAFLEGTQAWTTGAQALGAGSIALRNLTGTIGGTLLVNGNASVQRLQLGVLGVLGGTGTLTIQGTGSQWTAGTMNGGGTTAIAAGADLTLAGTARKYLGSRTIDNLGTLVEASTGDLVDFDGAATLNNGGLFDVRGDQGWQDYLGAAGTLVLNNSGTLRKSAGAGNFQFLDTVLNNTGRVEVLSGTLEFGGGGTSNGVFDAAAGTEIAFLSGTQTWNAGAAGTGAGAISVRNLNGVTSGTLAVAGNVTVQRVLISGAGVLGGAGTLTLAGTGSQWTSGTMNGGGTTVVAAGADLTLSGAARKYLGARTITNNGTVIQTADLSEVELDGAASFNNAGLFDIQGDQLWRNLLGAAGTLAFNNTGTLRKSAGSGDFRFLNTTFSNSGTVQVLSGRILVNGVAL